jgi:hypothetical protein
MHERSKCGRCGSGSSLRVPGTPGEHSHIVVGDRLMHTILVTKYVCTDCGCIEEWVSNPDDLKRLKQELNRDAADTAG